MVAEAPKTTDKPRVKTRRPRGETIPIYTRLKARNLYLSQGLGHKLIAEATGLTEGASQQLAHREGWTEQRRKQTLSLAKQADARTQDVQSEVLDSIASLSEQHAIKGLERVGNSLERDDETAAKDFQSYTSGVKNLVSVIREVRRPDAELNASAGANVNLFFFAGANARVSAGVDTAIDVTASDANPEKLIETGKPAG